MLHIHHLENSTLPFQNRPRIQDHNREPIQFPIFDFVNVGYSRNKLSPRALLDPRDRNWTDLRTGWHGNNRKDHRSAIASDYPRSNKGCDPYGSNFGDRLTWNEGIETDI